MFSFSNFCLNEPKIQQTFVEILYLTRSLWSLQYVGYTLGIEVTDISLEPKCSLGSICTYFFLNKKLEKNSEKNEVSCILYSRES